MLLKNTIGILIIVLNVGGIGYLLFLGFTFLKNKYLKKKELTLESQKVKVKKKKPKQDNLQDNILNDEDDLLKNMDLSDLDDLNLDDFD